MFAINEKQGWGSFELVIGGGARLHKESPRFNLVHSGGVFCCCFFVLYYFCFFVVVVF